MQDRYPNQLLCYWKRIFGIQKHHIILLTKKYQRKQETTANSSLVDVFNIIFNDSVS